MEWFQERFQPKVRWISTYTRKLKAETEIFIVYFKDIQIIDNSFIRIAILTDIVNKVLNYFTI